MTPQQQNALNAAQIQHDMVRRNLTSALLTSSPGNQVLISIITTNDVVRQAAGETIEYTDEAKMLAGMIPGTTGLTLKNGGSVKVPAPVAPPPKNG